MGPNVIIDIVLGLLSLLIVVKFTIRGFLRSILDTLKVPIAALIAYVVRIPVAKMFHSWFMKDGIVKWVRSSLEASLEGNDTFINFVELYEDAPKVYTSFLSKFGLGDVSALDGMENASLKQIDELSVDIGSAIAMFLSTVLAVICLFIVTMIALMVFVKLIDSLLKVTAIRIINHILGFALGVALAIGFMWGVAFLLDLLVDITNEFGGKFTKETLENSMIVGMMREIF